MLIIALATDAIFDTGDGITHYEIARWSWKHPELLLHHWGKPFFTLLSSPFAQFGYKGILVFNVTCHVLAAWVTWRVADRMKLPFAFLAGPLLIFAPLAWGVAQSGLTEPLFALSVISGVYFITGGRYLTAALLISLLPFARTEGFFLAPLFGLFFLLRREYLAMCLLATGTVVYSLLGALFVHHDILWIAHGNPYVGEAAYGSGSLFHFVANSEFILGWALTVLVALGLLTPVFRQRFTPQHSLVEITLVFGGFVLFYALHSVFWWKGWFGSYGLLRVMVCVMPFAVIIALRGLQFATRFYENNKIAVSATVLAATGMTIFNTTNQYGMMLRPDDKQKTMAGVADLIRTEKPGAPKYYFGHPLVRFLLEKDPYDETQCADLWSLSVPPLVPGGVVVWDSHFGPVQYRITEEHLLGNPALREITRVDNTSTGGNLWIICEVK